MHDQVQWYAWHLCHGDEEMPEGKMISLRERWSKLYSTLYFKMFLALVALELTYSAAKDFMLGFGRGIYSVAGG